VMGVTKAGVARQVSGLRCQAPDAKTDYQYK
jgi:hypothetical protein